MAAPSLASPLPRNPSPAAVPIFIVLALVQGISYGLKPVQLPPNTTVPAVFVFGDSVVDTGNNNDIVTIAKCNYPPYGRDFPGQRPTGRFSNGRVPSDMLAEMFGVKKLVPAYLDPDLQIQDLLTGVTFASGANGYDPFTSKFSNVLTLTDQLDLYKEGIARMEAEVGKERAAFIVSQSVHVSLTGNNDISNTFFGPFSPSHNISSYTDLMAKYASSFIQDLYGLGARRIGMIGLPPLGCVPSQRTLRGGMERNCFKPENDAAVLFNSKLSSLIDSLSSQLPDAKILYIDIYYTLLAIIQNPSKYGFQESTRGCCGTGYIEVTLLCNKFDDYKSCADDDKYVFWDSFHPSQKAYEVLVQKIFEDNLQKFF